MAPTLLTLSGNFPNFRVIFLKMIDKRLEDRQIPFLDKLGLAREILTLSSCTTLDKEDVLNWTLLTLLKLSKAPNPRADIFTSDSLWNFMLFLFSLCYPSHKP